MVNKIITLLVFLIICFYKGEAKNDSLANDQQQWLNITSSIPDIPVRRGLAGSFTGIDNNVLIIAGGSYFNKALWEGGRKVYLDSIFVCVKNGKDYQWQFAGKLPYPIVHGAAVATGKGLLCIGGESSSKKYWSGCAEQAKWGLEIGGLAVIDLDNHTAFNLEAVQTLIEDKHATRLTDWDVSVLKEREETHSSISKFFVADAWFPKKPFVDRITAIDMHLRDNADLNYMYLGPPTSKRGRPSKYAGKQHTGLTDSQAGNENKLNFHFNAALNAINIAKVEHWLNIPHEVRIPISMADIITMNHNRLQLQQFIDVFGVNAYSAKNQDLVNEHIYYGTIAA